MAENQQRIAFIGLGNPGSKYALTRHNLGFLVVEELAKELAWPLQENKRFFAKYAKGRWHDTEVHLLLPLTFMNESGWSVKQYLDYYKLSAGEIVVVCDDTALDFGQLRLRTQGSAGGHNGLRSIIAQLGTEDFARLRMGIGSKSDPQSLADYVLSNFTAAEMAVLDKYIQDGAAVLKALLIEPIANVMSRVNTN